MLHCEVQMSATTAITHCATIRPRKYRYGLQSISLLSELKVTVCSALINLLQLHQIPEHSNILPCTTFPCTTINNQFVLVQYLVVIRASQNKPLTARYLILFSKLNTKSLTLHKMCLKRNHQRVH